MLGHVGPRFGRPLREGLGIRGVGVGGFRGLGFSLGLGGLGVCFTHQQARTLLFARGAKKQGVGGRVTLEPRAYGGETLRTQS